MKEITTTELQERLEKGEQLNWSTCVRRMK